MIFARPLKEIIHERHSCRSYERIGIDENAARNIDAFLESNTDSPFGSKIRFKLVSAARGDNGELKGLGTYGFIRNPAGFIIGAMDHSVGFPEDYGFRMEGNVLFVTSLGIGSCWLGGSFRRSRFARKIGLATGETVPAVVSIGHARGTKSVFESVARITAGSDRRKPRHELFFDGTFGLPLTVGGAGRYGEALDMLRLAPSASNKQPWRVVKKSGSDIFHFYLERTKSYTRQIKLLRLADLQRIDMGIAMGHFELAAREAGFDGRWVIADPMIPLRSPGPEYVASWVG